MASPTVVADDLIRLIDKTLEAKCLDKQQTAVSIVEIPNGRPIYTRHAEISLLPASVLKMVTTAAALDYLGPEYRFTTDILYSGRRLGDTIEGDLIIRGGGDPKLATAEVMHMVSYIRNSGIRRVNGNLVADSSFFDAYDSAPSWDEQRSQRAYDAKIGALSVDYNTVAVHIQAGEQMDDPVNVWLEPAPAYLKIRNNAKTSRPHSGNTVWAKRSKYKGETGIDIHGRLPAGSSERTILINIDDPVRFALETFRSLLTQAGVEINGNTVLHGITPDNSVRLHRHYSPPLSMILKELNTYSNNFVAEQVLKTMAAEKTGNPGSHADGVVLLMQFLQANRVNVNGVKLVDGSGLSRENRFTAQAMTDMLTAVLPRFDIAPDFVSSLRIMGAEGLLSNRLKKSPAHAQIRAKTGSLNKVSNLAGYVAGAGGRIYAYALFLNNNRCGYKWADVLEDRIVTAIHTLDKGRRGAPMLSRMWSGEFRNSFDQ